MDQVCDHSFHFRQSLKKLAIVERLFRQLGTHFSGRCRCREEAISGGLTVFCSQNWAQRRTSVKEKKRGGSPECEVRKAEWKK